MSHIFVLVCVVTLGLIPDFSTASEIDIVVEDAWIPEAPPVVPTMAGYFRLLNRSNKAITLIGVTSSSFEKVELHRTEIVEGMARMKRQDRVVVPANETLSLEPGSYHLMLMGAIEPLVDGDNIELQLQFDHGQTLEINAKVKKTGL